MSTSKSHNEIVEIKLEITEITQDEAPIQQQVPKIIQNQTDLLEVQSDPQASSSKPKKNKTESILVKKPRKRKLKNEKVPLTENEKLIQLVRCMRCLYDPKHPRHRDTQVRGDLWDIIGNAMELPGNECEKRWSIMKKKFKDIIKNKKKGNSKIAKSLVWYEKYIQTIIDQEMKKSYPSTSKCSCSIMSHDIDEFLSGLLPTLKSMTPTEQDLAKTQIFNVVSKYEERSFNSIDIKVDMDWTE